MYAPIYLPQVKPASPEVAAAERAIIDAEGAYHVGGRYFANESDARQERRRLAERRVREALRGDPYDECWSGSCDGTARFRLATWITPRERQQVDAAVLDCVRTLHRDALPAVGRDLARTDADGALISAARIGRDTVPMLAGIVRGFPAHSIIGLVGEVAESEAISASLFLGQAGVRSVADVRSPRGWQEFRRLCDCARQPDAFMREALATVLREMGSGETASCSEGLAEFFRHVFSPRLTSAKELASQLGLHASTLMSRFYRAGLPSPKRYVAHARLIWAAHLAESPAVSISAIATRLNASSPQSFHRMVRTLMSMSAAEFRRSFDGARALENFRSRLVTPYLEALSRFDPLADSQIAPHPSARPALAKSEASAEQGRAA